MATDPAKATGITKVPKLRFPEFSSEWEEKRLGDLGETIAGLTYAPADIRSDGLLVLRSSNVQSGRIALDDCVFVDPEIRGANIARQGDILICVRNGSTKLIGKSAVIPENLQRATHGAFMTIFRSQNWSFVAQLFNKATYYKQVAADLGARINSINSGQLKRYKFWVPLPPEQQKIADFLGLVDARVQLLERRREALTAYKKGVMQSIFSQKIRFTREDGSSFPDWQEKRLKEVLSEHGEKSSGQERVHSVSVHKGVIDQIEHLGRSFAAANTDNYGLVKPGDIIYTKSPTGEFPFGIVKQSRLRMNAIVSPLYGIYTPETYALGYILNEHFTSVVNTHNYLHQLVQKGAKNTINITNQGFLQGKLVLPIDPEEQQKIADFLSALDDKISAVIRQITATQAHKSALLQQMFV